MNVQDWPRLGYKLRIKFECDNNISIAKGSGITTSKLSKRSIESVAKKEAITVQEINKLKFTYKPTNQPTRLRLTTMVGKSKTSPHFPDKTSKQNPKN